MVSKLGAGVETAKPCSIYHCSCLQSALQLRLFCAGKHEEWIPFLSSTSPSKVKTHVICKLMPLFWLYWVAQWLSWCGALCGWRHGCAHPVPLGSAQPTALLETTSWNGTSWNPLLLPRFSVWKLLKLSKYFYKVLLYNEFAVNLADHFSGTCSSIPYHRPPMD